MLEKLVPLILLSFLAGCATFGSISEEAPFAVIRSDKHPKEVFDCIGYEAKKQSGYWANVDTNIYQVGNTWRMTLGLFTHGLFTTYSPIAELKARPLPGGGCEIELRGSKIWLGKNKFADDVGKCAGQKD